MVTLNPVEAERNPLTLSTSITHNIEQLPAAGTALPTTTEDLPQFPLINAKEMDSHIMNARKGLANLEKLVRFSATVMTAENSTHSDTVEESDSNSTTTKTLAETAISILSEPNSFHDTNLLKRRFFEPCKYLAVVTNSWGDSWGEEDDADYEQVTVKRKRQSSNSQQDELDLLKDILRSPRGRRDDRGIHLVDSFEL